MRIILAFITIVFLNASLVFSQVTIHETIIFNAPDAQAYSQCTIKTLQNLNFGNLTQGSTRRISVSTKNTTTDIKFMGQKVNHGLVNINCPYTSQNGQLSIRLTHHNKPSSSAFYESRCDMLELEISQSNNMDAIDQSPVSLLDTSNHCEKEWSVNPNNGKYIHIGGTLTIPTNMPISKLNTNLVIETYY